MLTLASVEQQIIRFKQQFLQLKQGEIQDLLETPQLLQALKDAEDAMSCNVRHRIWTPLTTLLAFIKQTLKGSRCRDTVKAVQAERLDDGQKPCSSNTSAYCQARQKLPESLLRHLVRDTGERLNTVSQRYWSWRGRTVKLADGSTLTMPDTPQNQAAYPQESNQEQGVGFPIMRLEIVTSLSSGGVLDAQMAPYSGQGTGEATLLRSMMNQCFRSGDIALTDRYYDSFWALVEFRDVGADWLCPTRGSRKIDWLQGTPLKGDYYDRVFEFKKPARPDWMSEKRYEMIPDSARVRLFRLYGKSYLTTLMDSRQYRKNALRKLYQRRWQVEVQLKFIKQIMKMEPLRCKTPDMIRKEIAVFLLAYNLIRLLMLQAGIRYHIMPCYLSFRGALGSFREFASSLEKASGVALANWVEHVLKTIASDIIGKRRGRVEPRVLKRRHSTHFPYLDRPRSTIKQKIFKEQSGHQAEGFKRLSAMFAPT